MQQAKREGDVERSNVELAREEEIVCFCSHALFGGWRNKAHGAGCAMATLEALHHSQREVQRGEGFSGTKILNNRVAWSKELGVGEMLSEWFLAPADV